MRKSILVSIAMLAIVLHFAAVPAIAGEADNSRTGFFIGFGLGWGNAGVQVGGESLDRKNSGSGNFRFGWSVSDQVTMGLESTSWLKTYDLGSNVDGRVTASVTSFALTYFPGNMGLYFRGGMGVASNALEWGQGSTSISDTEYGLGFLAATGYEWRLTQKFALGPQFQYAYLNVQGDVFDSLDFISLSAQATWYW